MQILAVETTPASAALKAAKALIGQWPHAKPDNQELWIAGLAAALAGYPPGIVAECVDPRVGLARSREFPPTVKSIVDWCDPRLQYHRNWANYRPVPKLVEKPDPPVKHPSIGQWLIDLAKRLRQFPKKPKPEAARQSPSDEELRAHYAPQQAAAE